ncbi:hypothetical protein BH18PSE1_BH18PSE1_07120 [soil metagenome]
MAKIEAPASRRKPPAKQLADNPFDTAIAQLDAVAERIGLDPHA